MPPKLRETSPKCVGSLRKLFGATLWHFYGRHLSFCGAWWSFEGMYLSFGGAISSFGATYLSFYGGPTHLAAPI
jgi:hypothetical protein